MSIPQDEQQYMVHEALELVLKSSNQGISCFSESHKDCVSSPSTPGATSIVDELKSANDVIVHLQDSEVY